MRLAAGVEFGLDIEHEQRVRRGKESELVGRRRKGFGDGCRAVEPQRRENQLVAVEHERRAGPASRVRPHRQAGMNPRRMAPEADVQLDRLDEVVRHAVVSEADRLGLLGAHLAFRTVGWLQL